MGSTQSASKSLQWLEIYDNYTIYKGWMLRVFEGKLETSENERIHGMNTQLNKKQNNLKKLFFAYFWLRLDSLLAFGRCRLFFSAAAASLLDVSDVGVSSESAFGSAGFGSAVCGLSIGVVMIE